MICRTILQTGPSNICWGRYAKQCCFMSENIQRVQGLSSQESKKVNYLGRPPPKCPNERHRTVASLTESQPLEHNWRFLHRELLRRGKPTKVLGASSSAQYQFCWNLHLMYWANTVPALLVSYARVIFQREYT